ncbi:hypothetical protein KY285_029708 [Solanum tuberosum]|nr:hypothetical protein KY285_029708 [Solanum tuberosum]
MSFDTTKLLDPPRPSYTFSIYNRDLFEKSKFKDYDSLLEHRLARSQARANHLALILENGNVTRLHGAHESKKDNGKVPTTTSIEFANGEDQTNGTAFTGEYSGIAGLGRRIHIGATITNFPPDFYYVFRDTFREEVKDIPLYDAPLGSFDTCYMVDPGVVPTFPIVKMYFGHQSPENLLLLEQQRVVVHERGLFCLAFKKWNHPLAIIGSYQLQDACN